MSELKVDTIRTYTPNPSGIQFPNGLYVNGINLNPNNTVSASQFYGTDNSGLGYPVPAGVNAMTSKGYVDTAVNTLLGAAGLSGVSKAYVDAADASTLANAQTYSNDNFLKRIGAGEHSGGGLTFSGGPYKFTNSTVGLELVSNSPVLRLTELDSGQTGSIAMDGGVLKLQQGTTLTTNKGLWIDSSGNLSVGGSIASSGNLTLSGNLALSGNLTLASTSVLSGNLNLSSTSSLSSTVQRGSYGTLTLKGNKNGYSGIDLNDANATFMVRISDGLNGVYRNDNSWTHYVDGSGNYYSGNGGCPQTTVSPTLAEHLTRKDYVDTAISANNTYVAYVTMAAGGQATAVSQSITLKAGKWLAVANGSCLFTSDSNGTVNITQSVSCSALSYNITLSYEKSRSGGAGYGRYDSASSNNASQITVATTGSYTFIISAYSNTVTFAPASRGTTLVLYYMGP